jgi:sulfonate transport system substrate-binding protein
VRAQHLLRKDPARASEIGRRRFPPAAAEIIAAVVERDLPFYDPVIQEAAVATMNRFAQAIGLLATPVAYDAVVATRFRDLWSTR